MAKGIVLGIAVVLVLLLPCRATGPVDALLAAADNALDRLRTRKRKDWAVAAVLLAPSIVILGAFGVAPIVAAVYMSLFASKGLAKSFVGLDHYAAALRDPAFWQSAATTIYYVAGTIPATLTLSFLVALCLFRLVRGRGLLRTVYFLPYVTSTVAAAMVWRIIFHPRSGLANALLAWFGFEPKSWLLEARGLLFFLTGEQETLMTVGPSLALCCVILFDIWHSSGFMIVVFLAGLSAIPRELEESARLDGANVFQATWRITLPLLSPTIFFLAIISVIRAFQAFSSFYALTGNGRGPLDTTQNLTVYIFSNFYEYGRLGYGTAVAAMLCLGIVTLTLIQWRAVGRRVHYE
ncbi:MAG TPA: sugar ABC transporter permease [Candidatus Hydrogenedentes bacterium]|nr:sugar ABC transporter permease [Candidatus Hydrogenedentota bacterium]